MEYLKEFLKNTSVGGPHGSHYVYWIPVKIFNQLPIRMWKHNRPADKERTAEIHEYMKASTRMDGIIYLAYVNDEFVCYESNHRREALKGLTDVADILVDVLWDVTNEQVKEEFLRLNKAISVPDLYVEDVTEVVVTGLKDVVDGFCENYKKLRVSSSRPQRPNFTRDMIFDEFYRTMKEAKLNTVQLVERLEHVNKQMISRDKSKLPEKVIKNCEESGCWLFAWSSKLDVKDFEFK
jgi:hypothetical protein